MFNRIKAVIKRMLDAKDVQKVVNQSIGVSSQMRKAINDWAMIYKNTPPWSGEEKNKRRLLNLGKTICKELARLVLLECKVRVDNCKDVEAIMEKIFEDIRPHFEKALAKGGMAFKPYITGSGKVEVDFVDAENFFPIGYDSNGDIYAAIFVSKVVYKEKFYTRLEKHEYDSKTRSEKIMNFAYCSNSANTLGSQVKVNSVPPWASLSDEAVVQGIDSPMFSYFKVPFANTIDDESPLGVSVFEDCIDLLEDADRQYTRYLWEYEGGELAIDANIDMLMPSTDEDGSGNDYKMPENQKRLFRRFGGYNNSGEPFYKEYAPQLRDGSYADGLETIFRRIEFNASLAYGTLSRVDNVDKTAEEIKASKQRSYAAVAEIQSALQTASERLAYDILYWQQSRGKNTDVSKLSMTFTWDDSIIRDSQRELAERLQLQSAGVIKPWENRAWYLGESEDKAKEMCQPSDDFFE